MSTTVEQTFANVCSQFLGTVFGQIATQLKNPEYMDSIRTKSTQQLVDDFKQLTGVPTPVNIPSSMPTPNLPPGMGSSFSFTANPALNNAMMPSQLLGLSAQPPPSAGAKKGRGKAAAAVHFWCTLEEYKTRSTQAPSCAYMPNRGESKFKVCCGPTDNHEHEPSPLKWRCKPCLTKQGVIEKHINGVKSGATPLSGYNVPTSTVTPLGLPNTLTRFGASAVPVTIPTGYTPTNAFGNVPSSLPTSRSALPTAMPPPGHAPSMQNMWNNLPTAMPPPGHAPPTQNMWNNLPTAMPPPGHTPPTQNKWNNLPTTMPPPGHAPPTQNMWNNLPTSMPSGHLTSTSQPSAAAISSSMRDFISTLPIGIPNNLTGSSIVPKSTIPVALPTPTIPVSLPTQDTPVSLLTHDTQSVEDENDPSQIDVITTTGLTGIHFPREEKYRNLAIREQNNDLICIGRLDIGNDIVTETSGVPGNWYTVDILKEATADDLVYFTTQNIKYEYSARENTSV